MRSYNVTAAEISAALRIQNMEFPSGRLDEGQKETAVRTVGKIAKPDEFNDVVVATRGGYQVKIKDLGYTEDGAEEIRSEARLNGQPAVTLIVSKQSGTNTVAVAHEIKARLAEIEPTLPKNFQMRIIGDNSIFNENSLHTSRHLVVGSPSRRSSYFCFCGTCAPIHRALPFRPRSSRHSARLTHVYTLIRSRCSLDAHCRIVIDDANRFARKLYRFVEEKGMHRSRRDRGRVRSAFACSDNA